MQRGSRGTQRGGPCGRRGNRHQETQVSVAGAAIAAGSLPRQNQKAPYGHPQSASKAALPQNCLNCTQNCPPVREICKYVSGEEPANKRGGRLLPNETADWRFAARIRDRCARNGGAVARLCQAAAKGTMGVRFWTLAGEAGQDNPQRFSGYSVCNRYAAV
jgi:hypothetical protein